MFKTIISEHQKVVDFFRTNQDVFRYKGQSASVKYAFSGIARAADSVIQDVYPVYNGDPWSNGDLDYEIGLTMFMLLASIGIFEHSVEIFFSNMRSYLGRLRNGEIELSGNFSDENLQGMDTAISRAGEQIAAALREDPESIVFAMKVANAIGSFDWSGDRLDMAIQKLQERCECLRNQQGIFQN